MLQLSWFDHIVFEIYNYIGIDIDTDIADIDIGIAYAAAVLV